jgi:hypothetical protein
MQYFLRQEHVGMAPVFMHRGVEEIRLLKRMPEPGLFIPRGAWTVVAVSRDQLTVYSLPYRDPMAM